MKKHFNKLILIILLVIAVGVGIFEYIVSDKNTDETQNVSDGVRIQVPDDYIITSSTDLLANENNYIDTDETIVKGTLSDIVYLEENIGWFVVTTENGSEYKLSYSSMELILADVINIEDADGFGEVDLYFRTGGDIKLKEGNEVKLYKTASGGFSFDERIHDRQPETDFYGTITDFVFLPSPEQEGEIYISHMVVESDECERAEVYLHNLETEAIKSDGNLRVYYAGDVNGDAMFDTEEGIDFTLTIWTEEKTYTFEKDQEVNLKNNESKGYWEIKDLVDSTIYNAEVTGFEFGFTGDNITSLDYIKLNVEGEEIALTMLQTNALYAVPYGNYQKVYKYDGHDKMLSEIEPLEEFMIEMYYENDIMLEISIGTDIWVYKNAEDIWTVDYMHQEEITEEE